MKKIFFTISLLLILTCITKTSIVNASNNDVLINTDDLNVRSGASLSAPIIAEVKRGERYEFIEESDEWIKIKLTSAQSGWVSKTHIIKKTNLKSQSSPSDLIVITKSTGLRIRSGPGISFQVIGTFKNSQHAIFLEKSGEWIQISYNGTVGWVAERYIEYQRDNNSAKPMKSQPKQKGIVTASKLSIHSDGRLDSEVIDTIKKGVEVTISEENNDWYKIFYDTDKSGWVASWFIAKNPLSSIDSSTSREAKNLIKIIYDGTNIRSGPSTTHSTIKTVNYGDTFEITQLVGDWFEINLEDNQTGYIAGWIVEPIGGTKLIRKPGIEQYLKNQIVVIDPGHGGKDSGAIGINGTFEKDLTLTTAKLLYDKLHSAGANVFLTRSNDSYISLNSRVSTSHYRKADAFISLHYDSTINRTISGTTAYYYHSIKDGPLASHLKKELIKQTHLNDRGVKFGNYYVLRENNNPAVLLELGYLSNQTDEITVGTPYYQERASQGIYNGLAQYFKNK
ncbi:SH3 domain-containing protein [Metabacillus malikii]|uniref:N-acetylmuramoyl-L-alanine amidase n=1 Tax=Metabacillus malikii TaxID=1504265 RepID=A0ABT9ZGV4_9BACI|nr:SH3 domain-containing protein [Metabacillus malikii]MDQ0231521.1 N-acetylmuramoyl-L-alanine amidase [Metabacillus malikii]